MKGQTLFIRPIASEDQAAVSDFLRRYGGGSADTSEGILAKLVGDLAAVLTFHIGGQVLAIDLLIVREDLRRKRIGGLMLAELERMAASTGKPWLSVSNDTGANPFLEKAGFTKEGDSMVKRVIRASR